MTRIKVWCCAIVGGVGLCIRAMFTTGDAPQQGWGSSYDGMCEKPKE